jgi:hypothetical protein
MRTPYLKADGHSWLYQRAVPLEFRDLVGKKTWTIGLGRIDRVKAVARVRELATQHDALIAQMKRVASAVREKGGRKGLATIAARADHQAYVLEGAAEAMLAPTVDPAPEDDPDDEAMAIGMGTQAARVAQKARHEAQDARQLAARKRQKTPAAIPGTLCSRCGSRSASRRSLGSTRAR